MIERNGKKYRLRKPWSLIDKIYQPLEKIVFGVAFGGTIYLLGIYKIDQIVDFVNIDDTVRTWLLILGLFGCVNYLMYTKLERRLSDLASQSKLTHEES